MQIKIKDNFFITEKYGNISLCDFLINDYSVEINDRVSLVLKSKPFILKIEDIEKINEDDFYFILNITKAIVKLIGHLSMVTEFYECFSRNEIQDLDRVHRIRKDINDIYNNMSHYICELDSRFKTSKHISKDEYKVKKFDLSLRKR